MKNISLPHLWAKQAKMSTWLSLNNHHLKMIVPKKIWKRILKKKGRIPPSLDRHSQRGSRKTTTHKAQRGRVWSTSAQSATKNTLRHRLSVGICRKLTLTWAISISTNSNAATRESRRVNSWLRPRKSTFSSMELGRSHTAINSTRSRRSWRKTILWNLLSKSRCQCMGWVEDRSFHRLQTF